MLQTSPKLLTISITSLLSTVCYQLAFAAPQPNTTTPIFTLATNTVVASPVTANNASLLTAEDINPNQALDTANALAKQAGVNVIRHGTQTGIMQINGASQDRVKVLIDGMNIHPACPNEMDPPLHYIAPAAINNITISKGMSLVSAGGDSLGSTVQVESNPLTFANTNEPINHGELNVTYNSNNNGLAAYLLAGIANQTVAFAVTADKEQGDDYESANGKVSLTEYDKHSVALNAGFKFNPTDSLVLTIGEKKSTDNGTPALGMDMVSDDAQYVRATYENQIGDNLLTLSGYKHDIDHVMDNYSLRPKGKMQMVADASSEDIGGKITLAIPTTPQAVVNVGIDTQRNHFNVVQKNALKPMMQRDLVPNGSRNKVGVFVEQTTQHSPTWQSVAGVRSDYITLTADKIQKYMMAKGEMAKVMAFNQGNRDISHTHVDAMLNSQWQLTPQLQVNVGVSRNTRSPSLIEQFLWRPSPTYAQADGMKYVGNMELEPEVAHQVQAGLTYQGDVITFAPSVYVQKIDDFIQGTPTATAGVLQFNNTEAEIYGVNADYAVRFTPSWKLAGNLSYVRGKNTELNDNLYRLAPLTGTAALSYQATGNIPWSMTLETVAAAKQDKVSSYNNEQPTDSWAIVNLAGEVQPLPWLGLGAGVTNVFDKYYAEHLAGVNRVNTSATGGTVAVGEKLPSPGRSAYAYVNLSW